MSFKKMVSMIKDKKEEISILDIKLTDEEEKLIKDLNDKYINAIQTLGYLESEKRSVLEDLEKVEVIMKEKYELIMSLKQQEIQILNDLNDKYGIQ